MYNPRITLGTPAVLTSGHTLLNLNHPDIVEAIHKACQFEPNKKITHILMEAWTGDPTLRIYTKKA